MEVLRDVEALLCRAVQTRPRALCPGAVAQVAVRGAVLPPVVAGDAVLWADGQHRLPQQDRVPMRADTVFDIASVTKVFTAVVALRALPRHGIRLDDRVAGVLGEYAVPAKSGVTWRHLLTHTSGLPPTSGVWQLAASPRERRDRVLATHLRTGPGLRHEYSCVGYITAGLALERVTGLPLDTLLRREVSTPLELRDTAYACEVDASGTGKLWDSRIAATECLPGRGMVRGRVHDELARSLGGPCGNAGIFATTGDLVRFGLALCDPDEALLTREQRLLATTDQRPDGSAGDYGQAIGLRVGDPGLTPGMPGWCGHTGFTGTSMVLDPHSRTVGVLLTNRVHPSREWSDLGPVRRAFSGLLHAAAVGG